MSKGKKEGGEINLSPEAEEKKYANEDEDLDFVLPVCCGNFSFEDAIRIRPLWEETWSQDERVKRFKESKG